MTDVFVIVVASLFAIYVAIPIAVFLPLFAIGPLVAPILVNVPYYAVLDVNGKEVSSVRGRNGFFTTISPGQAKIIERGEKFVSVIMRWPGYTFKGYADPDLSPKEYWEVAEVAKLEKKYGKVKEAYPVPPMLKQSSSWWTVLLPWVYYVVWWRAWQNFIYSLTGYVFTGIPPFQTIRVYPIEYFEEVTQQDGKYMLERKSNHSDHYRIAEFNYPFPIESSDTQDMIPARIALFTVTRVVNPYLLAYNTDKEWASRFGSTARDILNNLTRRMKVKDIIGDSSGNEKRQSELLKELQNWLNRDIKRFGLKTEQVYTPERDTTDSEAIKRLGAPGFAQADAEARGIEAEAEAEAIARMAKSIQESGDDGQMVANIEGRIRTVDSAGDRAIVNIGDGDTTRSALLKEMREKKPKDEE